MTRALSFYRDGLGLEIEFDRVLDAYLRSVLGLEFEQIHLGYLRIPGGGFVELLECAGIETMSAASRPCYPGGGHHCFYVHDIDGMYGRLRALGFQARSSGVADIISGPNQGARSVCVLDQDGYASSCSRSARAPDVGSPMKTLTGRTPWDNLGGTVGTVSKVRCVLTG